MIRAYVETSGESPLLARAEAASAAEALGGTPGRESLFAPDGLVAVELPDPEGARALAGRLALAHRCLVLRAGPQEFEAALAREGARGDRAAFRRIGRPSSGGADPAVLAAGRTYVASGGRIDLERPERRFWIASDREGADHLLEEVAPVDRSSAARRRTSLLPFQRPVTLAPRLARAAANLARIRPGDRTVDPFLGTGALLAEAGLLGGRICGIDRDPEMVRGALRNLAHLGLTAESLVVGDAMDVEVGFDRPAEPFDAVLTDPPYGRASSTGGEPAERLVSRILPRWADRVRTGGRVVVVQPEGAPPLPVPWEIRVAVSVRVHRSLTREFRVYERAVR